ncbi:hypothetical protein [Nonomuraea soli]|uniref:WD40 repeat domain-containing protein n=1 Tax=Nonomuraea soli TaxID=1032476 RepID=A0A7W0HQ47_9ACTN|nr:hypothetical protein [Nonomuraea soli]MBA2891533.1 hypothetical protein [Nonomuraea soli]
MARDFGAFAFRAGPDLAKAAYLLTGDEQQALRLVRHALVVVGSRWRLHQHAPVSMARLALYRKALADGVARERVAAVAYGRDHVSRDDLRVSEVDEAPPLPAGDPPEFDLTATVRSVRRAVVGRRLIRAGLALTVLAAVVAGYLGLTRPDPAVVASGGFTFTRSGELLTEVDRGWMHTETDGPGGFSVDFALPYKEWTAWKPPVMPGTIRYAAPLACPGGPDDPPEKPGDIVCAGWGLMIDTYPTYAALLGTRTCLSLECAAGTVIGDAAVQVRSEGILSWTPSVALSRDGRQVAYLDALRRRWVVAGLDGRGPRDISPVLTAGELAQPSTATFSADGLHVVVRVDASRAAHLTDVETGRTTPADYDCGEGSATFPSCVDARQAVFADYSPDGRHLARAGSGEVTVRDAATRRDVAQHMIPAWTSARIAGWIDDGRVLVHLAATGADRPFGYFSLDARTGALTPVAELPAELDPHRAVIGVVG